MKSSRRFKMLIYVVMNISTFFFSAIAAIQEQMSIQRGLIIYLASAFWINLLLWYVFRTSDRRSRNSQP
jgi:hypothetical protein